MRSGVYLAFAVLAACAAAEVGTFWHLTDVHYQPDYKVKTNPITGCMKGIGNAGKYGMYLACDLPEVTMRSALDMMRKENPNPDFFVWSGDMAPHAWKGEYTAETAYNYAKNISALIREYFPDVPVVPVLGNHDAFPQHQMPAQRDEYYERIVQAWEHIMPEGAEETFLQGGFYSTSSIVKSLRIVVLNSALYYKQNKLVDDASDTDPAGQLAWLHAQLQEARDMGQRALLIYHVPPGGWPVLFLDFGYQMKRKLNEHFVSAFDGFHDLIIGHLAGHTHTDEFRFLSDESAESVLLIAPSLGEWSYTDPRMRLMKYDRDYPHNIIGYDQFRANVHKANKEDKLEWYKEYSFNDAYGVPDMTPKSARAVFEELRTNETLQLEYLQRVRSVNLIGTVCHDIKECAKDVLCSVNSSYIADVKACQKHF